MLHCILYILYITYYESRNVTVWQPIILQVHIYMYGPLSGEAVCLLSHGVHVPLYVYTPRPSVIANSMINDNQYEMLWYDVTSH